MKKVTISTGFMTVIDHGYDQIVLEKQDTEFTPVEFHYKEDGSIDDKPSIVILMKHPIYYTAYGQMSLKTLNDCLNEVGYEIKKKDI